ncbi:hypothetical protein EJP69_28695 [Variovorax gossypii]|uniref:Uncharacterized protein n=1 Tax=Variovorax gossypii TaxID=1679495 RepID=A0A431TE95_9BURK|nr:hypothetical protein [Variovorax gossypii]RTQ30667.1 hypothetical protein EJP69_28695 [Variovorax gossypii]
MTTEEFCASPIGTHGNVLLNWRASAPEDVLAYAEAYRNAAHGLIDALEQSGETSQTDHTACPAVFLYRHAIELYLKAMLHRIAKMSVDDQALRQLLPRLWREHSLAKLLDMAQPVLAAMRERLPLALRVFDEEELQFLFELDRIDPGSYAFRYPVASTGGPSMPSGLRMNVFAFARMADRTLDALQARCLHFMEQVRSLEPQMRLSLSAMRP